MAKFTDLEKKNIVADYVNCQNYSEVARKYNVSVEAIRRIVKEDSDIVKKLEAKKEENTKDILQYMDSIYDKQKSIIDLSLSALEEKLKSPDMFMNVKDIATVYGVIFDKALKYKEMKQKNNVGNNEVKKIQIVNDLPKDDEDGNS